MKLDLPELLRPIAFIPICLPSGRLFDLPHCYPTLPEWSGPTDVYTFGGKPLLKYGGAPVFAELYALRLLQDHGWDGVWVSAYRKKYLQDMPADSKLSNHIALKPGHEEIIKKIGAKGGGCFDVFAWRGDDVLFCECKRHKRDRLRETQFVWIDLAVKAGFTNLLVVEWDTAGRRR
ncbi:MAG TPA: hypothetical protein VFB23_04990 [Candidatus Acidoferrales bacterium]|nr:hypothetical protein [Candidatus Acidoferrales bacterium]